MGVVDQVTQRNAAAAEELSSTAAEMASQAEALQARVAFFRVEGDAGPSDPAAAGLAPGLPPRNAGRRALGAGAPNGHTTPFRNVSGT
jgi:methyl-accepting chemotaxis protein